MENKGFLFGMIVCSVFAQTQCFPPFDVSHQSLKSNLKNQVSFNRVSRQDDAITEEQCMLLNSVEWTPAIATESGNDNCEAYDRFVALKCSMRNGDLCFNQVSITIFFT